jgi:hypothetical protein
VVWPQAATARSRPSGTAATKRVRFVMSHHAFGMRIDSAVEAIVNG